ncbi:hypothetical protein imdm_1751 [gamma proteobacterium IMCC2047]|nr:hypothetical protein imdm_1751 [gamma proteobacterium IMCC2047]
MFFFLAAKKNDLANALPQLLQPGKAAPAQQRIKPKRSRETTQS